MLTRVLFVDDDPMLLATTQRQLADKLPEVELVFLESAAEALIEFATTPSQIVFSDLKMPGMDGVEFLSHVAKDYPETIRIAWTGHARASQLERVFPYAHQILCKPVPVNNMERLLQSFVDMRRQLGECRLANRLTSAEQTRLDCQRIGRMLQKIDDPGSTAKSVAAEIDKSPIARARLLGLVNSSMFGLSAPITETGQAITMVGFGLVRALFVACQYECGILPAALQTLFRQSVNRAMTTAIASGKLARENQLTKSQENTLLLAAMFHTFGLIQFAIHGGETHAKLRAAHSGNEAELIEQETATFGASRYQIAAYVLSVWGFDANVCQCIASLHDSSEDANILTAILREAIDSTNLCGVS